MVTKGEDGPAVYEIAIKTEVVLTAKGKSSRRRKRKMTTRSRPRRPRSPRRTTMMTMTMTTMTRRTKSDTKTNWATAGPR